MGRPASPGTKFFQRKLGQAERNILLAAGDGNMSKGFMEVIDAYAHFYNLGLRPGMRLDRATLTIPLGEIKNASEGR